MAKELAKQYDPSEVEDRTYKQKNLYNSYSASEYYRSASYGSRT